MIHASVLVQEQILSAGYTHTTTSKSRKHLNISLDANYSR